MKKTVILIGIVIWLVLAALFGVLLLTGLSGRPLPGFLGTLKNRNWQTFVGMGTVLIHQQEFDLGTLEKLRFDCRSQAVRVTFTDGDKMTVTQYDREGTPAFSTEQSDSEFRIDYPTQHNIGLFAINFDPRLEISMPRRYKNAVDIATTSGSIQITGAAEWGDTSLNSSSGSIRVSGFAAWGNTALESSSGSIHMEDGLRCAGLSVKSSSGSQRFGDVTANGAEFSTSSGSIRLGSVDAAGRLDVSSSSGSIHAEQLTGADFHVSSSSGSVNLDKLDGQGDLKSTSGSIRIDSITPRGDITSQSSSGSQTLGLVQDANCRLELQCSSGSIYADDYNLSFSDRRGKNATGTAGTGENGTLRATSTSGSIRINKA